MSDASPRRSLRCPNCGAPVDFAEGQASVHCRFRDSVIEHSPEAITPDGHAHRVQNNAPDWFVWKNDTLWMVMDEELLNVDTAHTKIVYRWP